MLEVKNICKRFGDMYALNHFNLSMEKGTVHGLVGENGAGKSTLIKILTGVYHLDSGEIFIDGKKVEIHAPTQSQALGISVIHQDRNLVPAFNGVENVYLGRRGLHKLGVAVDFAGMKKKILSKMQEYEIEVPLDKLARELTPPQKTLLEIVRAIMVDCKLLILDEPTVALTDKETEVLFRLIEKLRTKGTAILYVSHRMDEIFQLTDKITVMKNGELVGTVETALTDRDSIIAMMTDNWKSMESVRRKKEFGDAVLEVQHIATNDGRVKDASFCAHRGEILGIFGLGGSGRTELLESIYGLRGIKQGTILRDGKPCEKFSPEISLKNGMVIINEDRRGMALVPSLSIRENIVLSTLQNYKGKFLYNTKREMEDVVQKIEELGIKTTGPSQTVSELSGGNQQKVVFAKALMSNPQVFLCDEPTQAVDVKTRAEIHEMLRKYADEGSAVVFVTSDLKEMLEVADNILIISNGYTKEMLKNKNLSAEQVLKHCYAEN
jgi:ribose transport system ATP-binding protein